MGSKTRADLLKRLDPYWKMEAGNVVLVPAIMLVLSEGRLSWISLAPLAATMLLLVIGALYWRGKVRQLRGEGEGKGKGRGEGFAVLLRRIAAWRLPALVLCVAACLSAVAGWVMPGWSAGLADRNVATGCALLAVLEYVNYYHRQLQHFDNRADFLRLLAGKGFRQSWMARDLAALDRVSPDGQAR